MPSPEADKRCQHHEKHRIKMDDWGCVPCRIDGGLCMVLSRPGSLDLGCLPVFLLLFVTCPSTSPSSQAPQMALALNWPNNWQDNKAHT
jgi:hypothetical protein